MSNKAKPRRKRKHPNDAGLVARNFPRALQYRVDYDYVGKLSQDERNWLAAFTDAYIGGDFRGDESRSWDRDARRFVWTSRNAARSDYYTAAVAVPDEGGGAYDPNAPGSRSATVHDPSPVPAYLDGADYKAARDAFRTHLTPSRRPQPPKPTRELGRARRRLDTVTPGSDDNEVCKTIWENLGSNDGSEEK